MIRLNTTTRTLVFNLDQATSTNNIPILVNYSDNNGTTYTGGTQTSVSSNTSNVTVCNAPASSTVRDIDSIIICNSDSNQANVNVFLDDNGTYFQLLNTLLQINDSLIYTHGQGWKTVDNNGSTKTSVFSQTAINLAGAVTLPNGVSGITQSAMSNNTLLATTNYVDRAVANYSASIQTIYQITANLGTQPAWNGNFTFNFIPGGLTVGAPIMITQAANRPGSVLYDSVEMDQIHITGVCINSNTIQCNWGSSTAVCNSYTFNYWI